MKMLLKDGKRKVLTLSYDDGVPQDKRLVEILDRHGIKCTFNINSGQYGGGRMTREEAVSLYRNSGHEVAVHGYTHPFLEWLDDTEVLFEILEDRKAIEADYATFARGMAYPFGTYSPSVIEILKACGIVYARTVHSTHGFDFPENWLTLHPTCHHNDPELMELAQRFAEDAPYAGHPRMFYLWGHSYEFDDNSNWNLAEEFAAYIGNRDDIWYATNIEVYDYVHAYKNLHTSFDKKRIHNPSALDVWVEIGETVYRIRGGETLVIA